MTTDELTALLRGRRSIDLFEPEPIGSGVLHEAIEVARWAPNHRLTEPWRFYVVGEVNKPGEFPLVGRVTVMQALALASGFRAYAKSDELKLLRQEVGVIGGKTQTREVVLSINYKALAQGQNLHQNFVLKPGDVIVVP